MARPVTRRRSYLRYREDVGMESRCQECHTYWPLTPEFWDMKSFVRCSACWRKYRRAKDRARYWSDESVRERLREYQKAYRAESKHAKRLANQDRYWSDPQRERAKAQLYYWENRERILAYKKERYQRERDVILARRRAEYHARKAA